MDLFPKSEARILKLIYEEPGIRLGELIKKARISYDTAKKRLSYLIEIGVIREENITGGKKILIKNLYPNTETEQGRHVFSLIEMEKKGFSKDET